jgi:hypothetical protein
MNSGSIDPGSRHIAVTIAANDAPANPLRLIDAKVFHVGHWIAFDVPQTRFKKPTTADDGTVIPGEPYTVTGEWSVVTPEERHRVAGEVAEYLIANGVETLNVENVENVYGPTVQAVRKIGSNLLASAKIAERALTLWEGHRTRQGLAAPIRYELAGAWRSGLLPFVKDAMAAAGEIASGVVIKGKGRALDFLFEVLVTGWPGAEAWHVDEVEHVRDSTGLALYCVMPPGARRKARGATPRKRTPGPPKPRGAPGPFDLAKRRAKSATWAQRAARKAAARAARKAADCGCKMHGRHRKDCSKGLASSAKAVLRRAAGVPPKVDPVKWAAYLDGTG